MQKSITQNLQNDKAISNTIERFFRRFQIGALLKASNAYKTKGISVKAIYQYLFLLVFTNKSMYMDLLTSRQETLFSKDAVYRFMRMAHINWIRFTTALSCKIIKEAIAPLTDMARINVLIVDDSLCERNRSKKVELLARVFDHAKRIYSYGFRMLTVGWSDGNTFIPVNSILLSTEQEKNRINDAVSMDKRTVGYRRRKLSLTKGTSAMLELLSVAKTAMIPAKHVLFDSWFSSPSTLHAVKALGYDVVAMVKKTPKMFFRFQQADLPLTEIYKRNRKRRGRSKYLLSVTVDVVKDDFIIPAKVVYVRNRNKRKEYLCLISTDMSLDEEQIIQLYGKRWDIEVFFKVCKSYLKLTKECHSLSFDAMTAHTAVVFTRYMLLSLQNRQSIDDRSLGELFFLVSDELADITWIQAIELLLQLFRSAVLDTLALPDHIVNDLIDTFIAALPAVFKQRLSGVAL